MRKLTPKQIAYIIILAVAAIVFLSCGPSKEEREKEERLKTTSERKSTSAGITIMKIDGCEYIYCETPRSVSMTHKANCKNH